MRWPLTILLLAAAPAAAQMAPVQLTPAPITPYASPPPAWNAAAAYITPGQDEPGYRYWYSAAPLRQIQVKAFNNYLNQWGVGGIVPTWQLLRTATSWHRCGGQPFEVPPMNQWPNIVQTLRYVHGYVIPAVGPVEAVSAYRNPVLNHCAGGAEESAHKHYSAIDLVPLSPTTREQLMRRLCAAHARRGTDYEVGLGFYAFLRFHVDTTKFRRWGTEAAPCPPVLRPVIIASVKPPAEAAQGAASATATMAPAASTVQPAVAATTASTTAVSAAAPVAPPTATPTAADTSQPTTPAPAATAPANAVYGPPAPPATAESTPADPLAPIPAQTPPELQPQRR